MFAKKNVYNINVEEGLRNRSNKRFRNVVIGTTCMLIGYVIGDRVCTNRANKGLNSIFESDPTLKEHMAEAISKTMKSNLLK